jgi:hypothetical protein
MSLEILQERGVIELLLFQQQEKNKKTNKQRAREVS